MEGGVVVVGVREEFSAEGGDGEGVEGGEAGGGDGRHRGGKCRCVRACVRSLDKRAVSVGDLQR